VEIMAEKEIKKQKEVEVKEKPVKAEAKETVVKEKIVENKTTETNASESKTEKKEFKHFSDRRPRRDFRGRRDFDYGERNVEIDLDKFKPKRKDNFPGKKVFGRWSCQEVVVTDLSLAKYINLETVLTPHSSGRKTRGRFEKANLNIVERLINKIMRSGQGKRKMSGKFIRGRGSCGKKLQAMKIVENAFEIVESKTNENPIQILVKAVEISAPREDVTRVKRGGVAYSLAVDVAPLNRLDESLKNLALAGFANSFNKNVSAAEALAEELIAASKNDSKSAAVKRRDEVERIAKASR
jgi:small subunit ribosomal protein S7